MKTAGHHRKHAIDRAWTWLMECKMFRDAHSNTQEKGILMDMDIQGPRQAP